jgi:membrane protease YdiL (CAAX protease family)
MKKIAEKIRRHPLWAFFLFTFVITWPAEIIYFATPGLSALDGLLGVLAVFSPALMAMLISSIEEPLPKHESSRPRWIAFMVVWFLSVPILVFYGWKYQEMDLVVAIISASILALFPAWVISSAYARSPGIRKHFSTLLKPRGPVLWYLVIFLIFPGVQLMDIGITRLFGGEAHFILADMAFGSAVIFLLLEFLHGFLMTGGINEESGWRGFALPRLQARYSVMVSAGIVWFFWALWHLPLDIGGGDPFDVILERRLLWNFVVSILMAWVYNRTNGSILAPALLHPAMNTFGDHIGSGAISGVLFIGLAIFAFVSDQMWKKLPTSHPAVYRSPQLASQPGVEPISTLAL